MVLTEGGGGAHLELAQGVGAGYALVNDPVDLAALRAYAPGCPSNLTRVSHISEVLPGQPNPPIVVPSHLVPVQAKVSVAVDQLPVSGVGQVVITSSDAAVAGDGVVLFASYSPDKCGAVMIDVIGEGTANLSLSNTWGRPVGPARRGETQPARSPGRHRPYLCGRAGGVCPAPGASPVGTAAPASYEPAASASFSRPTRRHPARSPPRRRGCRSACTPRARPNRRVR